MAPKERNADREKKNATDLLVIQSQLDQNMLTLKVTRDPQSVKTLPIKREELLLAQNEGKDRYGQNRFQKTIFSHRNEKEQEREM